MCSTRCVSAAELGCRSTSDNLDPGQRFAICRPFGKSATRRDPLRQRRSQRVGTAADWPEVRRLPPRRTSHAIGGLTTSRRSHRQTRHAAQKLRADLFRGHRRPTIAQMSVNDVRIEPAAGDRQTWPHPLSRSKMLRICRDQPADGLPTAAERCPDLNPEASCAIGQNFLRISARKPKVSLSEPSTI